MLQRLSQFADGLVEAFYSPSAPRAGLALPIEPLPSEPISEEELWQPAIDSLPSAAASLEIIRAAQMAAANQIDAADYVLQRLIGELSTIMPLTVAADGSELRAILAEAERASARKPLAA